MTDILLILITWRLSSLLVNEDLPFSFAARFRHAVGIRYNENSQRVAGNEFARGLMCLWCTSVWVGWFVALVHYRDWSFIVYGLAYSAGAIVVDRWVRKP